jgi:hypothetical protein
MAVGAIEGQVLVLFCNGIFCVTRVWFCSSTGLFCMVSAARSRYLLWSRWILQSAGTGHCLYLFCDPFNDCMQMGEDS